MRPNTEDSDGDESHGESSNEVEKEKEKEREEKERKEAIEREREKERERKILLQKDITVFSSFGNSRLLLPFSLSLLHFNPYDLFRFSRIGGFNHRKAQRVR